MSPVLDGLRSSLDLGSLWASLVLLGDLLRELVGIERRAAAALWSAIQCLGSFVAIGWTTRRLLERWLIDDSMAETDRPPGVAPRWRCLLGFWRRVE